MKKRYLFLLICLTCLSISQAAWAQFTVTGTIKSQKNGSPIIGVNIYNKSSGNGTSTGINGKFTLQLPGNSATLRISHVGYITKNVEVSASDNTININLKEQAESLQETVVTGLATTTKKQNLANDVTKVSAEELTGTAPSQTLSGDLQGRIPGATVSSNSGAPGGGISIQLRGITTINGSSQPLYIVDGVFYDDNANPNGSNAVTQAAAGGAASNQDNPVNRIADLNPDDIESIQVLKGASAAAIYGARASNGVVIIQTKRGSAGTPQFSASESIGFVTIRHKLGTRQFTAQSAEAAFGDTGLKLFNQAQANNRFLDYEDLLFGQKGVQSKTNVSASFGDDNTSMYVSGLIQNDNGIIKTTGYDKQSIRANIEHDFNENFNISVASNYIHSTSNRGLTGNDNTGTTFGVALAATPNFIDLRSDANGNFPDHPFNSSNPLQTRDLFSNTEDVNRVTTSVNATYDLINHTSNLLSLKFIGGVDFYNQQNKLVFPSALQFEQVSGSPGTLVATSTRNLNTNTRTLLVDKLTPSENITLTSQVGYTSFNNDINRILNVGKGILGDQTNVDQVANNTLDQTRRFQRDRGFFVQEKLNLGDTYIITGALRGDKSDRNAKVNKFYLYPKASFAWNLTNEGFWKGTFFNNFKLRAAFGQTGNLAPFGSKFTTLGVDNTDGLGGTLINNTRGRDNIKPERQTEIEAGIDASLASQFASVRFTVYRKTVENLLLQRQLPTSTGFSFESFNSGSIRNRGIEVQLHINPVRSKNLFWRNTINFSLNRSEITDLPVPPFDVGGFGTSLGLFRIAQGASATQIVGLDPKTDANGNLVTDKDGNPVIVPKTLGNGAPDFQISYAGGFNIFKNLNLSYSLIWRKGQDIINLSELLFDLNQTTFDYDAQDLKVAPFRAKAAGIKPGDSNGVKRLKLLGVSAAPFIQNASFLKVNRIGLYYTLPLKFITNIYGGLRKIKVGVSANDLFTVTPFRGYNTEVSNFGNQAIARGIDVDPFPSSKRFLFHFKIDF